MHRMRSVAVAVAGLVAATAQATVSDFLRAQTVAQGRAIVEAARAMPADKFGGAPTPDPMTFAELLLHVAQGNYLFCSRIGGTPEPALPPLAASAPKPELVARVQASFDFCSRAVATLNDSKLNEQLRVGDLKTPRSMAILTLTGTWNAHITMAHDYLAQNGVALPVVTAARH